MSRTFKDRKGYKSRKRQNSHMNIFNRSRGSYEDYDHSDQELYVYDQNCDNCCYRDHCCHTPYVQVDEPNRQRTARPSRSFLSGKNDIR